MISDPVAARHHGQAFISEPQTCGRLKRHNQAVRALATPRQRAVGECSETSAITRSSLTSMAEPLDKRIENSDAVDTLAHYANSHVHSAFH